MKKNKVSKLELAAKSGRFIGLQVNARSPYQVCAKVLNLTPSYAFVYDVNAKRNRRILRSLISD